MSKLKIYQHINAQAQLKIVTGKDKEKNNILETVKFTGGRILDDGVVRGGQFMTEDEDLQKALEKNPNFKKTYFIAAKVAEVKETVIPDEDYEVFADDNINDIKNRLKDLDDIEDRDLVTIGTMEKASTRIGYAFPNMYESHSRFAQRLLEEEEMVSVEELMGMKREALNAFAADQGVSEPEKLPNKQAVIEALQNLD